MYFEERMELVRRELASARLRALETLYGEATQPAPPAPVPAPSRAYRNIRRAPTPQRRRFGLCAACGCGYDDATPGCGNCYSRHAMRRYTRDRSAA